MKPELSTEDKQRIEREADNFAFQVPYDGTTNFYDTGRLEGFRAGAEYATRYEREQNKENSYDFLKVWNRDAEQKIQQLEAERSELQGKVDAAYDWLWQYNEELKSTNVFHKNEAIIGRITKLLNSLKTK